MIELPNKKYNIIYADPPWHYNDRRNTHTRFSGGAVGHYTVMKTEDICKIPVNDIADKYLQELPPAVPNYLPENYLPFPPTVES